MRKIIPPSGESSDPPGTDVVLGCGVVTPEMQSILGSIESHLPVRSEDTEKFLRDAVGKLFIAALGQMYEQHYGKKYQ